MHSGEWLESRLRVVPLVRINQNSGLFNSLRVFYVMVLLLYELVF